MSLRRHPTHGFTMIEIIVALAILTFGVCAVYDHFLDSQQLGREQINTAQARYLALQELERLRACPYASLRAWTPPAKGTFFPDHPRFTCQDHVAARVDGALDLTVEVGWGPRTGGSFAPGNSITLQGVKTP